MAAPFTAPPNPARGFRTLLGRMRPDPQAEAIAEVRTLLAAADRLRDLPTDAAALAAARHHVALASINDARHTLYREYLRYCLADRHLSEEEMNELAHLRALLRIDAADADLTYRRLAREIYSRTVEEVLADARIDEDERAFLENLRAELSLPDAIAENIEEMKVSQRMARDVVMRRKGEGQAP